MTRLGIVVALAAEARTLGLQGRANGSIVTSSGRTFVCVSGMGRARAHAAGKLLLAHGANALLSWGTAVALDSTLSPGHLLLPLTVLDTHRRPVLVSVDWQERLAEQLGSRFPMSDQALIATDAMLTAPVQKRHLHAVSGAIAADMESAELASLARSAGVPFLALRAIADTVESRLPAWIAGNLDEFGRARRASMLPSLIMHPGDWPDLIRLARDFGAALKTLQAIWRHVDVDYLKPANTVVIKRTVTIG